MKCHEARKWMSPYLDSELGQTKTFEVGEHLAQCESCAAKFAAERRADELIRGGLAPEPMPEELWSSLTQRISGTPATLRFPTRLVAAMAAVAAVLIVAVVGVTMFRTDQTAAGAPYIVRTLALAAPNDAPFTAEGDRVALARRANAVLRRDYGVEVPIPTAQELGHHFDFELISAAKKTDDRGREYVEVRLNCCGEPILLALARTTADLPRLFEGVDTSKNDFQTYDAVNVATRRLGDTTAVIASKHVVGGVLGSLRVVGA